MAGRHCSTGTGVAQCTAKEMSRKKRGKPPCEQSVSKEYGTWEAVYQMAVPPDEERRPSTGSCGMGRLWRSSPASCMHSYWCAATLYRKSGMWSGGIELTKDRGMWNFDTRARSSGVAVESHYRAIYSQGP